MMRSFIVVLGLAACVPEPATEQPVVEAELPTPPIPPPIRRVRPKSPVLTIHSSVAQETLHMEQPPEFEFRLPDTTPVILHMDQDGKLVEIPSIRIERSSPNG